MEIKSALLLLWALPLVLSCEQEPQTFEDCLLKHVKDVGENRTAVMAVREACRNKFPKKAELIDPFAKTKEGETETLSIEEAFQLDEDHKLQKTDNGYTIVPVKP